jgi:hypothetical protein
MNGGGVALGGDRKVLTSVGPLLQIFQFFRKRTPWVSQVHYNHETFNGSTTTQTTPSVFKVVDGSATPGPH